MQGDVIHFMLKFSSRIIGDGGRFLWLLCEFFHGIEILRMSLFYKHYKQLELNGELIYGSKSLTEN